MNEFLHSRIKALIARQMGVAVETLRPDTRLREDLGMAGDDAVELWDSLVREFEIDMTDFEFDKHFVPEAGFLPSYVYRLLFDRDKLKYIPIRIADLVQSAEAKKWILPE